MQHLTEAEKSIMNIFWQDSETMFVADLFQRVKKHGYSWEEQTVRSFLKQLVEKGYLVSEKRGKQAQYSVVITRKEYLDAEVKSFLNQHFNGNASSLLASLAGQELIGKEDIQNLKDFWSKGREDIQ